MNNFTLSWRRNFRWSPLSVFKGSSFPFFPEKSLNILQYIQSNICYPEKIKAKAISQHFGISPNYLGRYFKKQTNETMQQYILNYKMKMVESRLLHSEMRISEIVEELGFTDESHLNRLFKKYKDCNPTDFRKKHRGQ